MLRELIRLMVLCCCIHAGVSQCAADVLFFDGFDYIDPGNWDDLGGCYTYQGELYVESNPMFSGGLSSVQSFSVPDAEGECIYFSGLNKRRLSNPAATSRVWIAYVQSLGDGGIPLHFGGYLDFVTADGVTNVYFGWLTASDPFELSHIGTFDDAAVILWKLSIESSVEYFQRADVYLKQSGEEWDLRYTCWEFPDVPLNIGLTGEGGGQAVWDDIEVGLEPGTPVESESWTNIKAMFRHGP